MKVGDISEPIRSRLGYHIIKLEDLLFDKDGAPSQAAISQIFIRAFDFEAWIKNQKKEARILKFIK